MAVHMDQIGNDNALANENAAFDGVPIAPASLRMGSRVRTTNAGSGEDWWRPGAPLALTLDTITPAAVFMLPFPITLTPGDTLDVELVIPGVPPPAVLPPLEVQRAYNVGISLNGWAAIEG